MKKFLILFIVVAVIGCTYSLTLINVGGIACMDAEYSVFTKGDTLDGGIWLYGDTFMTKCAKKDLSSMVTMNNVIGYQATFEGTYDDMLKELKRQNVAVIANESQGDALIIYGLSDMTGRSVVVDGKQVNVQVAIRGNKITVGTPLIMGSY